jgi:hypothetical protein
MSNFASSKSVILKNVRAQWLDIFTAKAGEVNGKKTEPKFKVAALFEPNSEAATAAKAGLLEAATALWGDNARNVVQNISANSKAVRSGNSKIQDDGSVREEFKDMLFISASNKTKPQVVGPKKHAGKWVTITEDGRGMVDGLDMTSELGWPVTVPYRGCYVNLKVQFVAGKAFKAQSGEMIPNQVYAKLEAVQFVKDGIAFGAGPTSAEGFGEEDVAASPAGSGGLFDDDIPF